MADNPLIPFLSSYAATAASDSLVDENVRIALKRHGVQPIEAKAPKLQALVDNFGSLSAINVILTGTAGDGKTYHIRKFYLDHLNGDEKAWINGGGIAIDVKLESGKTLKIVKDLSEVNQDVKAQILPSFAASLLGDDKDTVWLVAANDGQLLKFWRDANGNNALDPTLRQQCARVYERIMATLKDDLSRDPQDVVKADIHNLSRSMTDELFGEVLDSVLEHPRWDAECHACPAADKCPIRINRQLLRGEGSPFRRRLVEVMEISKRNDKHLPIRYVLVLVANILLGDSRNLDRPLLTCRTARQRAASGEYRTTNPFNNALGLNFRERDIEKLPVFSIMQSFGIGLETNNRVDRFLIDRTNPALHEKLEAIDPIYGARLFEFDRTSYLEGDPSADSRAFEEAMANQRRRLFFLLDTPSAGESGPISPWDLTIYRFAGHYLDFIHSLDGGDKSVFDKTVRSLIKGINRTLTGMMTEESEKLWLARSIGRLEGGVGRITQSPQPAISGGSFARVFVDRHPGTGRPQMRVGMLIRGKRDDSDAAFDLRPLQFEYLMRVSEGSLPSSFSRQCQQELRHFALVSAAFLHEFSPDDTPTVTVLSLSKTGQIQTQTLEI